MTSLDSVKVVVLGQVRISENSALHVILQISFVRIHTTMDKHMVFFFTSYKTPINHVTFDQGLSFSVLPPTKLPGSLKNIYKQIATDVPSFVAPTSGFVLFVAVSVYISLTRFRTI